jgi:hypothetical protein
MCGIRAAINATRRETKREQVSETQIWEETWIVEERSLARPGHEKIEENNVKT